MGSGTCIMYAPRTFDHDDETKPVVVDETGDPIESIRTAVEACPTGAHAVCRRRVRTECCSKAR
jgi:ferredoxin